MQPVYVEDVAEAVARVMRRAQTPSIVFEFGGPRVYSYEEFLRAVAHQAHSAHESRSAHAWRPSHNWYPETGASRSARKTRYVAETFRRRKDGEEWPLEMERNIDRNGSSKPRATRNVRTFGDLIDLHDEDMHEVGKPPRRSKAAVMASLKTELGSVKIPALNF